MAGVALLARAQGHQVSGADGPLYPPMSEVLAATGIPVSEGWNPDDLPDACDLFVIGNALSRGNPAVEHVLSGTLPYTSGPQFVAEHVLAGRHVIAVAGTHGKTTTASLIAWLLEAAGCAPGFLIGGLPENFGTPVRLGGGKYFVIEADEYDTAFFDKRAKFVHYRPRTLVLTNLEYDHADIYPDLAAIERQFHHLLRTVPGDGRIIANGASPALDRVLAMGCWTPVEHFGLCADSRFSGRLLAADRFELLVSGQSLGEVQWAMRGVHNMENALAALSAVHALGVPAVEAARALTDFRGVRRRLTLRVDSAGVRLYDDFAHHPTAIARTLEGLVAPGRRLLVVLEPRSRSMREGAHTAALASALDAADRVFVLHRADLNWVPTTVLSPLAARLIVETDAERLAEQILSEARAGDDIVIMSNGGFDGLPERLEAALASGVAS